MDIKKSFGTDLAKEVSGAWIRVSADLELLIARSGTRGYSRELSKQVERYNAALAVKDDVADDTSEMILVDVLSQYILLGWRGVMEFDGEVLEYSTENAKKLLQIKDFRKLVMTHSDSIENFKTTKEAETEKN